MVAGDEQQLELLAEDGGEPDHLAVDLGDEGTRHQGVGPLVEGGPGAGGSEAGWHVPVVGVVPGVVPDPRDGRRVRGHRLPDQGRTRFS